MRRHKKEISDRNVIDNLLRSAPVGRLGTMGRDGYPRIKPLNFVHTGDAIYFHSAREGEKIDDIGRDSRVCFEVDLPIAYVKGRQDDPCRASYLYRSVIIRGRAALVHDESERRKALSELMRKYQPEGGYVEFLEAKLAMTAVVRIDIETMTGKEDLGKGALRRGTNTLKEARQGKIIIALATLYIAWSSTYLAIRFSLESFPPFFTSGFRYMLVGLGMFVYLRWRGAEAPTRTQWGGSAAIGAFLLLGGTGGVVYAQQWVGSGTAALVLATTPLWTVIFAGIWKQWPKRNEWIGLMLGFAGILLLNLEGDLRTHPAGAALLVLAAASWAFGSVLSTRLLLPPGAMASAAQMFSGGLLVLSIGFVTGERVPMHPSLRALGALIYLAVFGSLLGYTAYTYLLKNVRPALATSYAYVNPVLAVLLGVWLAGESITATGIVAMLIILAGVVLVVLGQRK